MESSRAVWPCRRPLSGGVGVPRPTPPPTLTPRRGSVNQQDGVAVPAASASAVRRRSHTGLDVLEVVPPEPGRLVRRGGITTSGGPARTQLKRGIVGYPPRRRERRHHQSVTGPAALQFGSVGTDVIQSRLVESPTPVGRGGGLPTEPP